MPGQVGGAREGAGQPPLYGKALTSRPIGLAEEHEATITRWRRNRMEGDESRAAVVRSMIEHCARLVK